MNHSEPLRNTLKRLELIFLRMVSSLPRRLGHCEFLLHAHDDPNGLEPNAVFYNTWDLWAVIDSAVSAAPTIN